MMLKQNHIAPTCAIPSRPAKHSNELTVLQQVTSALDAGSVRMFANPLVAEMTPKRTKYGDMPSEVRRDTIR
jgi:hypothetical protein